MMMIGLEYFVSAAFHLNFTKAADECCITQTAMSLHIAKLERELGFRLFERDKRSVKLTPGGRAFYAEALKVLKLYRDGVRRSTAAASGQEGVIRLGFINYIERSFLPEFIRLFRKRYPGIEIILNKYETLTMIEDLRHGVNDFIIAFPYDAANHDDISIRKIDTYRICAVVNDTHPLADRKNNKAVGACK